MVGPSNLKTLHPLQVYSSTFPPPPSSSSSSSSSSLTSIMKIKSLIHTLVFSHVCRAFRYLNKAKSKAVSILVHVLKESQPMQLMYPTKKTKIKKIFFGSFRLHYNWCSSTHVLPVPARVYEGLSASHLYYDSTWNQAVSTDCGDQQCDQKDVNDGPELSGYLQWLEEKKVKNNDKSNSINCMVVEEDVNEIDKLADLFIAKSHEKFILEKQESYRRFQEMFAKSM